MVLVDESEVLSTMAKLSQSMPFPCIRHGSAKAACWPDALLHSSVPKTGILETRIPQNELDLILQDLVLNGMLSKLIPKLLEIHMFLYLATYTEIESQVSNWIVIEPNSCKNN